MTERNRRSVVGMGLVLPALLVVLGTLFLPTLNAVRLSLTNYSFARPDDAAFVGLRNFGFLFSNSEFTQSLRNTIVFAGVTVVLEVAIGLMLALLVNRAFRMRGLLRAAILFPWALPTALNAIIWRWMYNADFGVFNYLLSLVGVEPVNWLGSPGSAMASMMFVAIWKTSSFMALIILTGLQTIPIELYEAARIDGASRWEQFRRITFPLVTPSIVLSMLLRTMDAFRAFELPFALTQGGPAGTTQTLSLYGYRQLFQFLRFDRGSAVSVVQFFMLLVLGLTYIAILRKREQAL